MARSGPFCFPEDGGLGGVGKGEVGKGRGERERRDNGHTPKSAEAIGSLELQIVSVW